MGKKNMIKGGFFVCLLFTAFVSSFAEDVVVKEVSLKDSYKRLLEDYDVLKEDNVKSKEIMKKFTKKIELFANNIKMGRGKRSTASESAGK